MDNENDTYVGPRGMNDRVPPNNTGIIAAAVLGFAIVLTVGIVGIVKAGSADDHAGEVDKKVVALDKKHGEFAKATIDKLNAHSIELSADATALTVLNDKMVKLETKSVVAELAKELRDGKADAKYVKALAEEVFKKADAKTVKRLARRLNSFSDRLVKVEGIVLSKDDEPKTIEQPREEPPVAKPAPTPPTPQPLPSAPPAK